MMCVREILLQSGLSDGLLAEKQSPNLKTNLTTVSLMEVYAHDYCISIQASLPAV